MNKILVTGCFALVAIAIIDCSIVTRNGDSDLDLQVVHQNDLIADEVKNEAEIRKPEDKAKLAKYNEKIKDKYPGEVIKTCDEILEPIGCHSNDTVIKGNPIKGKHPIRNVTTFNCCMIKCREVKNCNSFIWNSGKGPGKKNKKNRNTCWLKKNKRINMKGLFGSRQERNNKKNLFENRHVKKNCGKKCAGKIAGIPFRSLPNFRCWY